MLPGNPFTHLKLTRNMSEFPFSARWFSGLLPSPMVSLPDGLIRVMHTVGYPGKRKRYGCSPGMLVIPRPDLVLERCVSLLKFCIDLLYRIRNRGR